MPPLHYQWYKDGHKVTGAGADSARLVLVELGPADAGMYTCTISNQGKHTPLVSAFCMTCISPSATFTRASVAGGTCIDSRCNQQALPSKCALDETRVSSRRCYT
jgi:hypothetical protein